MQHKRYNAERYTGDELRQNLNFTKANAQHPESVRRALNRLNFLQPAQSKRRDFMKEKWENAVKRNNERLGKDKGALPYVPSSRNLY